MLYIGQFSLTRPKSLGEAALNHYWLFQQFDMSITDNGKLALALDDTATILIGTPTVHMGLHPCFFSATHLVNIRHPKWK